jgi:hypothetical protein
MAAYDYLIAITCNVKTDVCVIWPYQKDRDGYGRVSLPLSTTGGKKIKVAAHRLAFKIANGDWPNPAGLHRCDNPSCFNARHIFEGTDKDNHVDQVIKGRTTRGNMQRDAKLTDETVRQARSEYIPRKMGFHCLAKKYGVSKMAMRWAVIGRNWKHVQ